MDALKRILKMTAGLCLFVALFLFVNKTDAYAATDTWTFGSTNQMTVTYNTDTDTATITGTGAMDGRPFETGTGIQYKASVKTVVIESGVTEISLGAFSQCTSLESITIPDSVTKIQDGAFAECSSLTSVAISDQVTFLGNSVFRGCSSLTSVNLGSGITRIKNFTFDGCSSLTELTIPDSVTTIDPGVFTATCTSLKKITVGKGLSSVTSGTFVNLENVLEEIRFTDDGNLETIGEKAFIGFTKLKTVVLPNTLITIDSTAFKGCTGLTSITLPGSLTTIKACAFEGSGLTAISVPNSVTTLASASFKDCTALKNIEIGNGISSFDGAFYGCTNVESFKLTSGNVTTIPEGAFAQWTKLKTVTLGTGITTIGNGAFGECSSLESLTLPDTVTTIGVGAFYGCTKFTTFTVPDSVTAIPERIFSGCILLDHIQFSNSVATVGNKAFENCSSLKKVIFTSAPTLGTDVFSGCTNLVTVAFPLGASLPAGSDPAIFVNYADLSVDPLLTVSPTDYLGIGSAVAVGRTISLNTGNVTGFKQLEAAGVTFSDGAGSNVKTFVMPASNATIQVKAVSITADIPDQNYTGNSIIPSAKVTCDGNLLTLGKDYELVLPAGRVEAGSYDVKIKGKGAYVGLVPASFKIIKSNSEIKNDNEIKNNNGIKGNGEANGDGERSYTAPLEDALNDAISAGGEQTVYWSEGTALSSDIIDILVKHPNITLVFSYSYMGKYYQVSLSGKFVKAEPNVPWYGPVYLYIKYANHAKVSNSRMAESRPVQDVNGVYTVAPGDTLSKIAARHNTTVARLALLNNIQNPNYIRSGQEIKY